MNNGDDFSFGQLERVLTRHNVTLNFSTEGGGYFSALAKKGPSPQSARSNTLAKAIVNALGAHSIDIHEEERFGWLCDADTGEVLRSATESEADDAETLITHFNTLPDKREEDKAAKEAKRVSHDVITASGRKCRVVKP